MDKAKEVKDFATEKFGNLRAVAQEMTEEITAFGEINAEMKHQTLRDSTEGAPAPLGL